MGDNKLYIAAAGAGKTTFVVKHALKSHQSFPKDKKVIILTFTRKNQSEIEEKVRSENGYLPSEIKICGWYSFLLDYCIRPFIGTVIPSLYCQNIGLLLVEGVSGTTKQGSRYMKTYKAGDSLKKYFSKATHAYSDKLSELAFECYSRNKKDFIERISNIFHSILIDEVQDLAAWDFELLNVLIKNTDINFMLCGDPRQKTYETTSSVKNKKYSGGIDRYVSDKINQSKDEVLIDYSTLNKSHRFGTVIADFASKITQGQFPNTEACTCNDCLERQRSFSGRSGVYLVKRSIVDVFLQKYSPTVLIWDKNKNGGFEQNTITYGNSKGMTTNVSLIIPTKSIISNFLSSKTNQMGNNTRCKLYVAVTRARYIIGILVDDSFDNTRNLQNLPYWSDEI
jgi:hypothetical protein